MLRRRLDRTQRLAALDPLACSSYEDLRARSAIHAYVVGERHEDETIFELARKFSASPDSAAVERTVRDLVAAGLLTIDRGKVVPGPAWHDELVVAP